MTAIFKVAPVICECCSPHPREVSGGYIYPHRQGTTLGQIDIRWSRSRPSVALSRSFFGLVSFNILRLRRSRAGAVSPITIDKDELLPMVM